ncbi:MAG TPA: FecR domain-containing protein [Prolixibacteraceae bacterium]|jgi:ferric-dicitrate binding protein FerR (iron transport regulator)
MSEIDNQRIENYFKGEYSSGEEKYLGNVFTEASNVEALKAIFKKQWNESFTEDADNHQLNHILYKLNYQINVSQPKVVKPRFISLIAWYARIAAILLIPLLVYTGIITHRKRNDATTEGWAEMSAPLGSRIKFSLPDGSFGWLNSGSTIKYALNFNDKREVQLSGQAYFDVIHRDDNKFVVKTKYLDIEDKGTAFDVAAYDNEDQIDVTLERGSVLLKNDKFTAPIEMSPNEQINYNYTSQKITKAIVTAQNISAWKEGKLILRNASLEEVAKQLSRWYNIDVSLDNIRKTDFRYRATFKDENLEEVLRLLKISSNIDYKMEERVKQADGSFSKQKLILKVR